MSFRGWKLSKSKCERLRGRREASLSSIMAWLWRAWETWWDERRHSPPALRKRSRGSSLVRRQDEPACPSGVDVKIRNSMFAVGTNVPAYVFGPPRPALRQTGRTRTPKMSRPSLSRGRGYCHWPASTGTWMKTCFMCFGAWPWVFPFPSVSSRIRRLPSLSSIPSSQHPSSSKWSTQATIKHLTADFYYFLWATKSFSLRS